jgi:hypothetical protein
MNNKIVLATCLTVFTCTLSLPVLALKTAPVISKVKTQNVLAAKSTKKSKKISLNRKATAFISCGKK